MVVWYGGSEMVRGDHMRDVLSGRKVFYGYTECGVWEQKRL
jgi:hypothetical protein